MRFPSRQVHPTNCEPGLTCDSKLPREKGEPHAGKPPSTSAQSGVPGLRTQPRRRRISGRRLRTAEPGRSPDCSRALENSPEKRADMTSESLWGSNI